MGDAKLDRLLCDVRRAQAANDHDYERLTASRREFESAEKAEEESRYALEVARMAVENYKRDLLKGTDADAKA